MNWQISIGISVVVLFSPILYVIFTNFVKNWKKHSRNFRATVLLAFYVLLPVGLFWVGAFGLVGLRYIPGVIYAWGFSIAGISLFLIGAFAFIKRIVLKHLTTDAKNVESGNN